MFVERTQQLRRKRVVDIAAYTIHIGIGKDVDHIEQFFTRKMGSKAKDDLFTVEILPLGNIAHECMVLNKTLPHFDQLWLHIELLCKNLEKGGTDIVMVTLSPFTGIV